MKAHEMPVGTAVVYGEWNGTDPVYRKHNIVYIHDPEYTRETGCLRSLRSGIVIANQSRQGDEVVIVEWDMNFRPEAWNVNDLKRISV